VLVVESKFRVNAYSGRERKSAVEMILLITPGKGRYS